MKLTSSKFHRLSSGDVGEEDANFNLLVCKKLQVRQVAPFALWHVVVVVVILSTSTVVLHERLRTVEQGDDEKTTRDWRRRHNVDDYNFDSDDDDDDDDESSEDDTEWMADVILLQAALGVISNSRCVPLRHSLNPIEVHRMKLL